MRVVLIVTGGIAAYKALEITRLLRGIDVAVQPMLTQAAQRFVTPLSLAALAGQAVLLDADDNETMPHIYATRGAAAVLIAPATADFMAQLAAGMAHSLPLSTVLAAQVPVFIAPAMNPTMWQNPATQRNVRRLQRLGMHIIAPEYGMAACGDVGEGRLAAPHTIVQHMLTQLPPPQGALTGQHAVVTAGATREPLDPVRCITNHSSGKQGYAIAQALWQAGARVTLITGETALPAPLGVHVVGVQTAQQMHTAVQQHTPADIMVGVAAVADYAPVPQPQKIKKEAWQAPQHWQQTPDIIASATARYKVAFAAETCNTPDELIALARVKLQRKQCQLVVANNVTAQANTFGSDSSVVHFVTADAQQSFARQSKTATANALVQHIAHALVPAMPALSPSVAVQLLPHAVAMPHYASAQAAGLDLTASEDLTLLPQQRGLMPTGLCIALPQGTEAQIRPRSGLALKQGLTVLNAPGTIDADYRGEIKVLLLNAGQEPVHIKRGDRIAQMVVAHVLQVTLQEQTTLESTQRQQNGFGSTGV